MIKSEINLLQQNIDNVPKINNKKHGSRIRWLKIWFQKRINIKTH